MGLLTPVFRLCTRKTAFATRALHIGARASVSKTFQSSDVESFVQLTGDSNPIHARQDAANASGFDGPVLPGILVASLFPALIGSKFPGTVYASQTLRFRAPALVGHTVVAMVIVQRVSGRRVTFATTAVLEATGQVVIDGEALALIPGSLASTLEPPVVKPGDTAS